MKLPEIKNAPKYVGLYIVDFGDTCSVGYKASEVARLLESEKFGHIKVYKIHNANPDGTMELKGVPNDTFNLEMGMFFYSGNEENAKSDYQQLVNSAIKTAPPAMAKVHMAKYSDEKFAVALIFAAEYNDEFSTWLTDIEYKTQGSANGGIDAATQYYKDSPEILERHQLLGSSQIEEMANDELLIATKKVLAR